MANTDELETIRLRNARRLIEVMNAAATEAAAAGLTEEILVDLLADKDRKAPIDLVSDPQEKSILIELSGVVDSEGWK